MYASIASILHAFEQAGFDASDRQEQIVAGADFIVQRLQRDAVAQLVFVCTHNSRRSQFAQVWASVAATHFRLRNVASYSGGTEITACNERTIASLERFGFKVASDGATRNPRYLVSFDDSSKPAECSSKLYTDPGIENFAAMMCCSDVDQKCPLVHGAAQRIAWHYDDPKVADDTDQEQARYDERSRQIGHDMYWMMSVAKKKLSGS